MSDLNTLLAAEEANRTDYHWMVAYSVRVHDDVLAGFKDQDRTCSGCGEPCEDEDIAVITDAVTVGCGPDAAVAVERARVHVLDEEEYGVKTKPDSFQLKGVKLLSVREI
jgi:hypothetical protein